MATEQVMVEVRPLRFWAEVAGLAALVITLTAFAIVGIRLFGSKVQSSAAPDLYWLELGGVAVAEIGLGAVIALFVPPLFRSLRAFSLVGGSLLMHSGGCRIVDHKGRIVFECASSFLEVREGKRGFEFVDTSGGHERVLALPVTGLSRRDMRELRRLVVVRESEV